MTKPVIVFDWDGTLMDSAAKIVKAMQRAAATCQQPVPSDLAVRQIIGISLKPAIARLFSLAEDDPIVTKLAEAYSAVYLELDQRPCQLFDRAQWLLSTLKRQRYPLAVATGKARRGLNRALHQSGIGHYFNETICADESRSKPHPQMLFTLADRFDCQPNQLLMVGDTTHDINMAHAAGCPSVAVTFGAHHADQLADVRPNHMIDTLPELLTRVLTPATHAINGSAGQGD
ncbi:HAD-IA family hydrolase [Aestuariibacter halophilus]|uniref:HAD-IA family hydrolase n=1 Tax=Fluctibacter halophilus TaxID=226011 RepID=A0ABS8G517_9ALTE|nr:HAD-IA family hydrolase [Aestuariibacter halophilus]MCC2615625.1 HAD-IA family hydrolase [Aestuariibacter halophilus]